MLGSLNTGGAGADTLEVINRTGNVINSGDKVWINKSVTSEGSALVRTGSNTTVCAISPDGSKLITGNSIGNINYNIAIRDITNLDNMSVLLETSFGNTGTTKQLAYTDDGDVAVTSQGKGAAFILLRKNGEYIYREGLNRPNVIYMGGNYWLTTSSSGATLFTFDVDTEVLTQIANGNINRLSGYSSFLSGCYNTSTGHIINTDSSSQLIVSGSSITQSYSGNVNPDIDAVTSSNSNQGRFMIGNKSVTYTNGQLNFMSWDGSFNGYTTYSLSAVGLGYWQGKDSCAKYNHNTKILTVCSYLGTDYKVYRYDEQRNYFDEIVIQLNTAGNKFIYPITFSDDLKRCAYAFLYPNESSITNYGGNVKYMVEEIGASAKTIAVPYNFSNSYASTLTGVAETSGNNEETLMVRTVLPPKISVNVLADVNNMELVVR